MPHKDPIERAKWQFKRHLNRYYNMEVEEYNRVCEQQNGLCALCGRDPKTFKIIQHQRLAIDHCHKTGRIRGLICVHCNRLVVGPVEKIGIEKIQEYLNSKSDIIGIGPIGENVWDIIERKKHSNRGK